RARDIRPDVSGLQRRQADAHETAKRLQTAAGQSLFAEDIPRHVARSGYGAPVVASGADASRRRGRYSGLVMPLYEYECTPCGHQFEVIRKFSDPPEEKCPKCGGPVHKLQSAPAFQFKGSGWYVTDYGKSGQSDSKAGSDSKSDSKKEGATETAGKTG